jgi:hypothetical protein
MIDKEWVKGQNINGSWEWGSQFAGVKLSCNYFVFDIMSKNLSENPQIKKIVEIGTSTGGMALCLGMEAVRLGIEFHTYNIKKETTPETDRILNRLGVIQHIGDVFEQEAVIAEMLRHQPTYLIADGGNKYRETEMFVPYLQPDSLFSTHDYGQEIFDENISATMKKINMMPLRVWEWGEKNAQFMTWKILGK